MQNYIIASNHCLKCFWMDPNSPHISFLNLWRIRYYDRFFSAKLSYCPQNHPVFSQLVHYLVLLQDLVILHKFWKQPICFANSKLNFILCAFKTCQSSINWARFLVLTDTNKKIHTILEDFIVLTLSSLSLSRPLKMFPSENWISERQKW